MCLLIFKPEGKSIPYEYLAEADISNPHGCGIAHADGKRIRIDKHPKWGCDEIAECLAKIGDAPAIVHFRFATHGSQNPENTHPFPLPKNVAAAHNGVISGVKCLTDESDSRAFLRENVSPVLTKGGDIFTPDFIAKIGKQIGGGNKIAFLDGKGKYGIANESSGHWKDGVWYSNTSYVSSPHWNDEPDYYGWISTKLPGNKCHICKEPVGSRSFGEFCHLNPRTGELLCADCAEIFL